MNVRIVNNGEPGHRTSITNETGEGIGHVFKVEITLEAGTNEPPKAILHTYTPIVDVIADAEIKHVCPGCGRPVEPEPEPSESPFLGGE